MNLGEAIDRNVELKGELVREGRLEKASALKLLIEAGKRIQLQRRDMGRAYPMLLSGETGESTNDHPEEELRRRLLATNKSLEIGDLLLSQITAMIKEIKLAIEALEAVLNTPLHSSRM